MRKSPYRFTVKEDKPVHPIILIILGVGFALLGLSLNQQFPITLTLASFLSPTGMQASIMGFRIKHWVFGLVLAIISIAIILTQKKYNTTEQIGYALMGAGGFLIFDEYPAMIRTLTTGEYP